MKPIRKKKCKECQKSFTPYQTTQRVCSPECAYKTVKRQKEETSNQLEKLRVEKKSKTSIQSYLTTTKTIVHEMVRLRDKGQNCISCGCQWKPDFQAGHYHKAQLFTSLKFDFFNINGQCRKCNLYLDGNVDNYKLNLPYRIGSEEFQKLKKRAELDKKFVKQWTRAELQVIRENAKKIIKKLS